MCADEIFLEVFSVCDGDGEGAVFVEDIDVCDFVESVQGDGLSMFFGGSARTAVGGI